MKLWIPVMMIVILFLLFVTGYIANGLFGYKFDIEAIGITSITSGIVTFILKHYIDSKYNSQQGEFPHE